MGIPVKTTYLMHQGDTEVEYSIEALYHTASSDPEDTETGAAEPEADIVKILNPDGTEVKNWADAGFNDDTLEDIKASILENPPEEAQRPDSTEDSWPADMSFPTKVVSTGDKMEDAKTRNIVPEPPKHRSPLPPKTGGPMGRPDPRSREKQRLQRALSHGGDDFEEAEEPVIATDVNELGNKLVLVTAPTGDIKFFVWDTAEDIKRKLEAEPDINKIKIDIRDYEDMKTGQVQSTKTSIGYPLSKLQKFIDAGNVQILGSQREHAYSMAEQIEQLTRVMRRLNS
jgi:hypothetical protein